MRALTDEEQATVEANLGLARRYGKLANRRYPWLDLDDLIGASSEGLCAAVQRHRIDRGKLSTTANWYMRKAVHKLLRDSCVIVTPPWTYNKHVGDASECVKQARRVRAMERLDGVFIAGIEVPKPASRDDVVDLRCAMSLLSPRSREVLSRLVMSEESRQSIADDIGRSPQSVTRIRREALAELRKSMTR